MIDSEFKRIFLCEPQFISSAQKLQLAKAEIQFDDDQWTKENPYSKGENIMNERESIHDILARYASADVIPTQTIYKNMYKHKVPVIKNVVFNEPATIVFWADNTKTVVKAQNDEPFDPEKGLAMAIAKKALGNEGNYFNHIEKWVNKYNAEHPDEKSKDDELPWYIWTRVANSDAPGRSVKSYKRRGNAIRMAKKLYTSSDIEWAVSQTNPWKKADK